jgi:hypothetical protein
MPGRDVSGFLNFARWGVVLASLFGVLVHALGRFISRKNGKGRKED